MSQEIPADAVPFQDEERGTSGRYCRSLDTNIISEPMGESSDSCDSFEARGSSSRTEQQQKTVQNQIVIQNPRGPIHLGPVYCHGQRERGPSQGGTENTVLFQEGHRAGGTA